MKYLLSLLFISTFLYTPVTYAEDQTETESAALQSQPDHEGVTPESKQATLDSITELTNQEDDALKFRWLSHQRESLTLEQEKLYREISELENERNRFDEDYQNKDFEDANREIEKIEQKIVDVQQTIYELRQKQVTTAKTDEAARTQLGQTLEQQNALLDIHQEQLESIQLRLNQATHSVQFLGRELEEMEARIKQKKEEEDRIAARRFEVETQISELLNRDSLANDFRVQISIAFTVLVAIVILGFYWLAIRKDEVAKNIFVGEKGIQFITLFLIVIAIILFGIMGTLEGRELSALLGALAGYILGKTTVATEKENSGDSSH